jgi:hypothetical protein
MNRLLLSVLIVVTLPAVAAPPVEVPFFDMFDGVNPCTGELHTVTITGTTFLHMHNGRIVARTDRTIETSPTGFVGHGTDTTVANGNVTVFRLADVLSSPSGDKILAHFMLVVDDQGNVLATNGEVACLGPI